MSEAKPQSSQFNPLSMVDMWQDMRALVEQWESKHHSTAEDAAVAFQEFSLALVDQSKTG
tara:strand:+ start:3142 stop:3321 length:180 start_codon:yes stop_codon:yes gene_type:complete